MERRRYKRIPVQVTVTSIHKKGLSRTLDLVVEDAYFEISGEAHSGDISAGGMFIPFSVEPLEKGETVKLRFTLPTSVDMFEVDARVVWVETESGKEKQGLGIQFQALPEEARKALDELLKSYEES